jgi:hypothetical protein
MGSGYISGDTQMYIVLPHFVSSKNKLIAFFENNHTLLAILNVFNIKHVPWYTVCLLNKKF